MVVVTVRIPGCRMRGVAMMVVAVTAITDLREGLRPAAGGRDASGHRFRVRSEKSHLQVRETALR
jgi:hypothetical protein